MPKGNPEGYLSEYLKRTGDLRRPTQEQLNSIVQDRTKAGAKTEGIKRGSKKKACAEKKKKKIAKKPAKAYRASQGRLRD